MKVSYNCKFLYLLSSQIMLIKKLCPSVKIIIPSYISVYTTEFDSYNIYLNFSKIKSTIASKGYCSISVYDSTINARCTFQNIKILQDSNCLYNIVSTNEVGIYVVKTIFKFDYKLKDNRFIKIEVSRNRMF